MLSKNWIENVRNVLREISSRFRIEAAIIFGSWARSGGGSWSDIDLLVVTDDVKEIPILERFRYATLFLPKRVNVFIYTFEELRSMVSRGNPLALSALVEGLVLKASERVKELSDEAKRRYRRVGRVWIESRHG